MERITAVFAREIIDSRGNPTVEAEVTTSQGCFGRAAVPSGASTGTLEAFELRDGDSGRYSGKGVRNAVHNVNDDIRHALIGMRVTEQASIDAKMIDLDGTANMSRLGANAVLAVSLSAAKAAAQASGLDFYNYIAALVQAKPKLPMPMINILNGGVHANNGIAFQEFMIIPVAAESIGEAVRMGADVFHRLISILKFRGLSATVGDEGGVAPVLESQETALSLIVEAVQMAGYDCGKDILLSLDVASSEFYHQGKYVLSPQKTPYSREEFIELLKDLSIRYPIISIEDAMAEDDWQGWKLLTAELGTHMQLVGDDLFVTNPSIIQRGIDEKAANSVLIKLNQIGTLSQTLAAVRLAQSQNLNCVISHRSGETEDVSIADLAVGTAAGQIKTGSMCRTDRIAKYNQLLRIEEKLRQSYSGVEVFQDFKPLCPEISI